MTCFDFFLLSMFYQQSAYHIRFKPLVKSHSTKDKIIILLIELVSTWSIIPKFSELFHRRIRKISLVKFFLKFRESIIEIREIMWSLAYISILVIQIRLQTVSDPIVPRTKHQPCKCKECFNVYK